MRAQTKSALYQGLLLVVLTGCILAYCLLVQGPSDRTVMTRLFVGIGSMSLIFFAVVLYSRARILRRASRQHLHAPPMYIVAGQVVRWQPPCLPQSNSFWAMESSETEKNICSICLADAVLGDEKPLSRKSNCCGSLFHTQCTQQYWESIREVRCPNCRFHLLSEDPVVV